MGKIKRGGYFFFLWISDHGRHIHVRKDGKEILKWDLDNNKPIKGKVRRKILKLINQLIEEGFL